MPDSPLVSELQRLRRGRGVRRPKPESWIGPELRALVESTYGSAAGEQLRDSLIDLLRDASAVLTGELLPLYQAALGATDLEGLLTHRLELMTRRLQRDPRTLQRWLHQCDQLIAARLEADEQLRQAEAQVMQRGWTLARFDAQIRLDLPRPEYITRRTIHVTSQTLDKVTDLFSLPEEFAETAAGLEVEALAGCSLDGISHPTPSLWQLHLMLPRALRRGERWDVSTRLRLPSRAYASNHSVMAPARPCEAFDLRVEVGDSGAHEFRALSGIPLVVLGERGAVGTPVEVEKGTVTFSARHLTPGLAYGLRWSWPD